MTRASWSAVIVPLPRSTWPVRRPVVRATLIACSTAWRSAKPRSTTTSPMNRGERLRLVGAVRPVGGSGDRDSIVVALMRPLIGSCGRFLMGPVRPWTAGLPGSAGGVERLVDERVGRGVLGSGHTAHGPAVEAAQGLHGGGVQRLHVGVLDLVDAVDLLGDELGVVDDIDLGGAQRLGAGQAEEQPAVLGDVVRG